MALEKATVLEQVKLYYMRSAENVMKKHCLCETSREWRCRDREELSPSYALFMAEMGT